jgi:hypothetical protein
MRAMKDQINEQPKIIKMFSINYARDLLYIANFIITVILREFVYKEIS